MFLSFESQLLSCGFGGWVLGYDLLNGEFGFCSLWFLSFGFGFAGCWVFEIAFQTKNILSALAS